jgi:hypothetical protein
MTKFTDQLLDDLMHEHGSALAHTRPPAPRRHTTARPALLAAGGSGVAAAAVAGVLVATAGTHVAGHGVHVAGGGAPAYAVTANPNGTVTLAVYQKSGIAQANAKLSQLGDSKVVLVPVEPGCPSISSLPAPAVPPPPDTVIRVSAVSRDGGSATVNAQGIPAGDILVMAVETTTNGTSTVSMGTGTLTSPPAPSCVSLP